MKQFERISVEVAAEMINASECAVVDIRDENTFAVGHVEGSTNLGNHNIAQFINEHEFETPVLVFCYHGISSQGAAQYLLEQGFENTYSVDGGFEAWRHVFPDKVFSAG